MKFLAAASAHYVTLGYVVLGIAALIVIVGAFSWAHSRIQKATDSGPYSVTDLAPKSRWHKVWNGPWGKGRS